MQFEVIRLSAKQYKNLMGGRAECWVLRLQQDSVGDLNSSENKLKQYIPGKTVDLQPVLLYIVLILTHT